MKLQFVRFSPVSPHLLLLRTIPFSSAPCSRTPSFFHASDKVSNPYKSKEEVVVLCPCVELSNISLIFILKIS